MLLAGLRYVAAGLVMALVMWLQKRRWGAPRRWFNAGVAGFFNLTLGAGLTTIALPHVSSGLVAVLFAAVPLLICVGMATLGQAVGRMQWLGTLIGMAGLLLIVGDGQGFENATSLWLVIVAVVATALGALLMGRLAMPEDLVAGACLQMTIGGALTCAIGWGMGERIGYVSPTALAQWAYLSFGVAVLAYFSYLYLMAHVSPVLANSYAYVNPPVALWAGAMVLNEPITPHLILATAIVLVGAATVLLANQPHAVRAQPAPPLPSKASSFSATDSRL